MKAKPKHLMQHIESMPKLIAALRECEKLAQQLLASAERTAKDAVGLQAAAANAYHFLSGGTPDFLAPECAANAKEAGLPVPSIMEAERLPALEPRHHYAKVIALLRAAKEESGLTIEELAQAWKGLRWRGFENENLKTIIYSAVQTAQRMEVNIEHTGGRNGKYRLLA